MRAGAVDAEILANVSKQDVLDLFMTYIHPSSTLRSKLSVHMRADTAPPPKFSVAASEAYLTALKAQGVEVQEDEYRKLSAAEPPVPAVKAFWTNHFGTLPNLSAETAQKLLFSIDRLAKEHAVVSSETVTEGKLSDSVTHIQNMSLFKAGLTVSKAATPVQVYSDLDAHL